MTFQIPRRPQSRRAVLEERQRTKMARSAHAYVRGSTPRFYEWLESARGQSLPAGPTIWICGDCHTGNLGPVADDRGGVAVQIRDFDQAVIGNPAHDLIRLALSLGTAARGSDLPGITTAHMIEQMVAGYEAALDGRATDRKDSGRMPESVQAALASSSRRSWKELFRESMRHTSPRIPLGRRFWPLTSREREAIAHLIDHDDVHGLITSLRCREDDAPVRLLDAAYWMKGCSSLGRLRYAVLARVGSRRLEEEGSLCLVDIKEAVGACAPRAKDAPRFKHHGHRVVTAARALAPALGDRMRSGTILDDRHVFVRELLPQDLKLEIDTLSVDEAVRVARFLATVIGRAHARQMDVDARASWKTELGKHRGKSLDAPSWLWSSVVDLIATHEVAYLDHCRRYAADQAAPGSRV